MIIQLNNRFALHTERSTYAFHVLPSGHLEHLWYGEKLDPDCGWEILAEPHVIGGNMIAYSPEHAQLGLENVCLEYSSLGKGDIRDPMIELEFADGSATCDFLFQSAQVRPYAPPFGLPGATPEDGGEELVISLKDDVKDVWLELVYTPFAQSDVIVRSARIINRQDEPLTIRRLLSAQLDFQPGGYDFITFNGAWVREMGKNVTPCGPCRCVNEGRTGTSSNRANPFVMLAEKGCGEESGRCWASNLIYSGDHYESAAQNSFEKVRFLTGIHPAGFSWRLDAGEAFQTPQAMLCFSAEGFGGISRAAHHFVSHRIVRGPWQFRRRPVLLNSWESHYFDYNEQTLLELAGRAKEIGIELFVLDDGWFGNRDSDDSSLGDWSVNKRKFPDGISGFAEKLGQMGLGFGIWVEPEMISRDSDCYRNHPDWAVASPGRPHSEGRNQMILDLTRSSVREYVLEQMRGVFSIPGLSYVKWDMNRIFSDRYAPALPAGRQGEFSHRYVLGLYEILKQLTEEFPQILFESCAGGGNRSDLGMLCYMQQIWSSDNTDAFCRTTIQNNYSYGYPQSVIGAHVSANLNHQTGRAIPLKTRFHVACYGILGYECDLRAFSREELEEIKWQIGFYKNNRELFQFGCFHRLCHSGKGTRWIVTGHDRLKAIAVDIRALPEPNSFRQRLRLRGLKDSARYRLLERYAPYTREYGAVSGNILNHAGMFLYPGNPDESTNNIYCRDFESRMVEIIPE